MDGRVEGPVTIKQEDHVSEHWHNFPAGLRLLVVDDDPLCLKVVEQMLKNCSYEVTTCTNATMALSLLREKNTEYDLVLSDVYMPDMDGFKLLEVVGLEMDLPVIMMSSNGDTSNVLRGVTHGACDYLIKPVRLEELRNLWQHVVRRRRQLAVDLDSDEQSQERDDDPGRNKRKAEAAGFTGDQFRGGGSAGAAGGGGGLSGAAGAGGLANGTSGGLGLGDDLGLDGGSNKKARVVWSVEMHQQFVNAVNQLGIDKAVPKKILEIMNVEGLTRENVASHLQKYRLYLKRVAGVQQPNQPRAGKQSPPAPQSPPPPPAAQPGAVAAPALPPTTTANVVQQQQLPALPGLLGHGAPSAATMCAAGVAQNGQVGGSGPALNGGMGGVAAAAAAACTAGSQAASVAAATAADGGGHSINPVVAPSHPMAAAAAAVAAGGFPGAGPHPAALLAANPMMAAAAGLNPLLGAMGGLGVGPLGAMKPLNGMSLSGLQAPLGLLPSLPGSGGPLGHMGLPGLNGLTNMASPLSLGSMAGGLQQLAAANLMQGMAVAGMGQLPGIGMNGLMGTLPGVSLHRPQQHLFPPGPLPQHPRPTPQPQHQPEPKGPHHQGPGQQQPQPQQLPSGLQPQHSQHPSQQQTVAQQQPTLSLGPTARPVLPQQPPQPSLLQPAQSHPPPPQLPHSMSLPSPSALHGPQNQLQQLLLQQQQHQLLQQQHQLSQSQCTQQQQPLQQLLPSAASVGLHCGSGPTGLLTAAADADPGSDAAATDGTLDLHPDLIGRIIEDGFGAPPPGSLPGPPGAAGGCGGPAILDTSVVLADGDDGSDIAAVFGEMYGSGMGGGAAAGGLLSGLGGGMLGGGIPAGTDLTSMVTGVDTHRLSGDDDFLSYLLKG